LKLTDEDHARELLELLYQVPPLYHLNLVEWELRKDAIKAHYAMFSPIHRETALLPMTDFQWLNDDRTVQRAVFGEKIELVANFTGEPFQFHGKEVPTGSIAVTRLETGKRVIIAP
jgi:hypothetical protein